MYGSITKSKKANEKHIQTSFIEFRRRILAQMIFDPTEDQLVDTVIHVKMSFICVDGDAVSSNMLNNDWKTLAFDILLICSVI